MVKLMNKLKKTEEKKLVPTKQKGSNKSLLDSQFYANQIRSGASTTTSQAHEITIYKIDHILINYGILFSLTNFARA